MKNFILIWIVLLSTISVYGQQVVATSGNFHQNSTASISWTMGESFINAFSNTTANIYQGYQQGNQLNISLLSSKDTICEGESISVSAVITGGSSVYTYSWTSNPIGYTSANANAQASPTVSTWYIVNVSDGGISPNILDSVFIKVNPSNFNLAYTSSQTTFTSPPFNINIQNQTPNSNHYSWQWNMGDGTSYNSVSPAHTYGFNGVYSINALATDTITGCFDTLTKTDYISCSGGGVNPCTIVANISPSGQALICSNDSIKLTASSYPTALYAWILNGMIITGAMDSIYYASQPGIYQVMITDTICSVFSSYFNLINYPAVTPIITSSGTIMPCTNDSMELLVTGNYSAFLWSTGATSSSIFVNTSGHYVVSATDLYNCVNTSIPFMVNTSLLNVPEICIVGIDTATNNNRVIWQRQNNPLIDSFRIYRETYIANQYQLIGTKAFSEQSLFIDQNSNPAQQAYRYKISAIDTCGAETPLSDFHKTNHLTINAGMNNTWNLIWDGYQGFNFGSYRIYRGSDSTQMTLLTQIQSTLTSFTDLSPPTGKVYYQIEVLSPNDCYPDSIYAKANTNYNASRSNIANTNYAPNIGIEINNDISMSFKIYPNPNKGQFTLEVNTDKIQKLEVNIFNSLGSHIMNDKFEAIGRYQHKINLQTLPKGMYFIRLSTSNKIIYRGKVVIQ